MTRLSLLGGLAAVLGCVLAWELLPDAEVPLGVGQSRSAPSGLQDTAAIDPGQLAGIAGTLLQRPLFSPNRRLAPAGAGFAATGKDRPRLSGVITGPDGAAAILDDGSGRQISAATGDSIGRFKIGTITPGQGSVIASEGEHVLRPKLDTIAGPSAASTNPVAGAVE